VQSKGNREQLSKWLRPLVEVHANFGASAGSLSRFFADCALLKAPPRPAKPAPQVSLFPLRMCLSLHA
jgi:hypothetical protein